MDLTSGAVRVLTGKTYPTTAQQDDLIREPDASSHVAEIGGERVAVLVCHDLAAWSPRGNAVAGGARAGAWQAMQAAVSAARPTLAVQLPHTVDKAGTWRAAWSRFAQLAGPHLEAGTTAIRHLDQSYGSVDHAVDEELLRGTGTGAAVADVIVRGRLDQAHRDGASDGRRRAREETMSREQIPDFDLYKTLEVDPGASRETIEAAHRSLVRRHHPDAANGARAAVVLTVRLNVARDWLTDATRRQQYDRARRLSPGPGKQPTAHPDNGPGTSASGRDQRARDYARSQKAGDGSVVPLSADPSTPTRVVKGQRVGMGIVQHVGQGWYLVTSDGEGMYGNEQRRGGPGVGCGCSSTEPRVSRGEAVRYRIVGPIPPRYEALRPRGSSAGAATARLSSGTEAHCCRTGTHRASSL